MRRVDRITRPREPLSIMDPMPSDPAPAHLPTVLVVEDSTVTSRLLCLLLGHSGRFQVIGQAYDGQSGLEMARRLQPDILTLDLEMPVTDGLWLLHRLRAESDVPVVIVSALPGGADTVRAELQSLNVTHSVVKAYSDRPFDLSVFATDLCRELEAALGEQRSAEQSR
jgi:chemotaxis response regulator CheB